MYLGHFHSNWVLLIARKWKSSTKFVRILAQTCFFSTGLTPWQVNISKNNLEESTVSATRRMFIGIGYQQILHRSSTVSVSLLPVAGGCMPAKVKPISASMQITN